MASAEGGQPGRWTSTFTTEFTGHALMGLLNSSEVGMKPSTVLSVSTYALFRASFTSQKFRMVMIPPKTAQSPRAIKILHRSLISLATSWFVVLLTVPERIPTVTPSFGGCFKSVIGVEVSSIFSKSWTSLSSVSSKDISHPAHAASQSIATLTFVMSFPPNPAEQGENPKFQAPNYR